MRTSILALAAAAATLTGVAYAQQTPPPPPAPPPLVDPLGNGTVTRAEAQTKAAALFERFDANHDGKLDQADRAARTNEMFDKIDGNHDGALSREEFAAAHERMGGPMGRRMGGKGPRGGMDHAAMGAMPPPPPPPPGAEPRTPLSRKAFLAEAMKRFDAADANHDGKLTREERRAEFRAHMGKMRRGFRGGPDMPPPPPPPPPAGA